MATTVPPPLHRAAEPQTLLAGYTNVLPILVVDGEGAPLPLTGAEITADVDTLGGRSLGSPTVTVTDAEGGALTVSIAPGGMPQSGNRGHVGVRFDLGAGVVFEVQAEVRVQTGVAPDAGGGTYTLPTLTVTVSGAEGADVAVEWAAVRDLQAAIDAATALLAAVDDAGVLVTDVTMAPNGDGTQTITVTLADERTFDLVTDDLTGATVESAAVVDGALVLTMSDGREINAGSAPTTDPRLDALAAGTVAGPAGAAVDRRTVQLSAASLTAAKALTGLQDGTVVQVQGAQGGTFVVDTSSTDEDGVVAFALGSGDGRLVRPPGSIVTPRSAGAVEDGTDAGPEVQKFLDYLATDAALEYENKLVGKYATAQGLVLDGVEGRKIVCDVEITALDALTDILTISGCGESEFPGRIYVEGTGSTSLSGNTCVNGIRIEACGRTRFGTLQARGGQGWGVYHASGSSNMMSVENVVVNDFGSARLGTRNHEVAVTGFANSGSVNINQRTVVTLDSPAELPDAGVLIEFSFLVVGDEPYKVVSADYDAGTLTVYPRIPTALHTNGDYTLIYGGGCLMRADGFTNSARLGTVTPTRCGTGAWLTSSSPPSIGRLTSQFNGVALALGDRENGAFGGTHIEGLYMESEAVAKIVHVSQTSSFSNGTFIAGVTGWDADKMFSLTAKREDGTDALARYWPVTMVVDNDLYPPQSWRGLHAANADDTHWTLRNVAQPPSAVRHFQVSRTLNLVDAPGFRRLKGSLPIVHTVYGGGSREGSGGGYTGTLTVSCEEGYTINDTEETTLELGGWEYPATIYAFLEYDNVWRVSVVEHIPPGGHTTSGSGTPIGSVTPVRVGQEYLDTDADVWYKSTGLTDADWVALNS